MKKLRKKENKLDKSQLIQIGSFLIIILGASLIFYLIYQDYHSNKIDDSKLETYFQEQEEIINDNDETVEEVTETKENRPSYSENYIGVLEIKKISLTRGFYNKDSKLNNVNYGLQILNESNYPDEDKGNVIIASHSGNARVSYFRNLSKLNNDDEAIIHYDGKSYHYKLTKKYEIEKTGYASINPYRKNTLILITCNHGTNKQLVFIFELNKVD